MNKISLKKLMLATLLLTTNYTTLANDKVFQLAVVKGAIGASDITKGNVESSIRKLTASKKTNDFYANRMNLCVAYLQSKASDKAEVACSDAINSLQSLKSQNKKSQYLTALNYSNRGVAKYRQNQLTAALKDFELAVKIDDNSITTGNLQKFTQLMAIEKVESTSVESD